MNVPLYGHSHSIYIFPNCCAYVVNINLKCMVSTDPSSESRPESIIWSIYVPPDERCSPTRLKQLQSNSAQAIAHFLVPEAKSLFEDINSHSFESFKQILNMFSADRDQKIEGKFKDRMQSIFVAELYKAISHACQKRPVPYPLPQIISGNSINI